ncbi:MAG: NAD-dependent epimerase/dehydratase family protein [Gammaproteobacteria bacterium]
MNNVVVTGATGFVGRVLVRQLLEQDYSVIATRRRGSAVTQPEDTRLQWLDYDLGDDKGISSGKLENIDTVLHLAGLVHQPEKQSQEDYIKLNSLATERLAAAAVNTGVKHFIFISSIKVNGDVSPAKGFTEQDSPAPLDIYSESKLQAESLLIEACERSDMHYTILRPPLVFGPGVKANFLQLMKFVQRGMPLPFSAINNKRSLIYVDNLCNALITCMENPDARDNLFLVKDVDLSTRQLVEALANGFNMKPRLFSAPESLLEFAAALTGNTDRLNKLISNLVVDDTSFRNKTGWKPAVNFEKAIELTTDWYKTDCLK